MPDQAEIMKGPVSATTNRTRLQAEAAQVTPFLLQIV
jgi:hypothetical protein